tara:strand:+ start:222 stop:380 length:159 start_codon:yes stop_codon:yes gene_type:complete
MPVKQITEAKNKYQSGQSLPLIAKDYGASKQTLSHIFKNIKYILKVQRKFKK